MYNNTTFVKSLYDKGVIKSLEVYNVMLNVDRIKYSGKYIDSPNSIGENQTISAPHIHALALESLKDNLDIKKSQKIKALDIGCGSGYITACLSRMLEIDKNPNNVVVGIDIYSSLVTLSKNNVKRGNPKLLSKKYGGENKNNNMIIIKANGWNGYSKYEPYDVIHVGASADEIPLKLLKQLKIGGKMLIPVKSSYILITRKSKMKYDKEIISSVRFVPLQKPLSKKKSKNYRNL